MQSSHANRAMSSDSSKPVALQNTGLGLMQRVPCRPASSCERLGNCREYGMPSSHTQLMAFAFVTYMLLITRAPASNLAAVRLQRGFHFAQGAVLGLLSGAVAYSRIYLGYHSLSQVPLVHHCCPSAIQLMRSVLVAYGLLFTSCLSQAASVHPGNHKMATCASIGSRGKDAVCGSGPQPQLHIFEAPQPHQGASGDGKPMRPSQDCALHEACS